MVSSVRRQGGQPQNFLRLATQLFDSVQIVIGKRGMDSTTDATSTVCRSVNRYLKQGVICITVPIRRIMGFQVKINSLSSPVSNLWWIIINCQDVYHEVSVSLTQTLKRPAILYNKCNSYHGSKVLSKVGYKILK